ncbi:pyruvate dehydrogenase complex dihydrolipoamide acetyltransferase [Parasphingorhabdus sp.]|uniref:pyruvate dehydrogenase complex dihydrolipoamide acetyltransferase n=1 Tax=Parasphingorhabdus sp. TaxID=2709688 RepID=UPI0032668862
MPINLQMPALSPTMEEGTLSKWLVKEGDTVSSGDLLAEIETDKATMEFEAIDEGVIAKIVVAEGTDNVKVGDVIAIIAEDGEEVSDVEAAPAPKATAKPAVKAPTPAPASKAEPAAAPQKMEAAVDGRVKASPLARRLAEQKGVDLAAVSGSGPSGRIVKADIDSAKGGTAPVKSETATPVPSAAPAPTATSGDFDIPHSTEKLSGMRKTIARRLTEAKQTIPHIYLTVDIELDKLLKLRGELNKSLEPRGIKLSVNDLLIKALAVALVQVPKCNVSIDGDQLKTFERADISVAVSIPGGLITPIVTSADSKSLSQISTEMGDLAERAKAGKLKMHEYQGGTASISNMGMFGIKNFDAVINPPQAMIMAIGAGQKRPHVIDDSLQIATIMSATGSFDHRAIDGADGAQLMKVFKELCENPLGMLA